MLASRDSQRVHAYFNFIKGNFAKLLKTICCTLKKKKKKKLIASIEGKKLPCASGINIISLSLSLSQYLGCPHIVREMMYLPMKHEYVSGYGYGTTVLQFLKN